MDDSYVTGVWSREDPYKLQLQYTPRYGGKWFSKSKCEHSSAEVDLARVHAMAALHWMVELRSGLLSASPMEFLKIHHLPEVRSQTHDGEALNCVVVWW